MKGPAVTPDMKKVLHIFKSIHKYLEHDYKSRGIKWNFSLITENLDHFSQACSVHLDANVKGSDKIFEIGLYSWKNIDLGPNVFVIQVNINEKKYTEIKGSSFLSRLFKNKEYEAKTIATKMFRIKDNLLPSEDMAELTYNIYRWLKADILFK